MNGILSSIHKQFICVIVKNMNILSSFATQYLLSICVRHSAFSVQHSALSIKHSTNSTRLDNRGSTRQDDNINEISLTFKSTHPNSTVYPKILWQCRDKLPLLLKTSLTNAHHHYPQSLCYHGA